MPVQLNIFLLLFGGLQGLLLSLFMVRKKLHQSGYIFLLLYFAVMLLQITLKVMSKLWLMENWRALYQVSYLLPLLYGPLLFLFVRQLVLNKKFHTAHLLHFLPFIFLFTFLILAVYFSVVYDALRFFYRADIRMIIQLISLMVYHWLAMKCWLQHKKSLKNYFSDTQRLQMNWVRQFIIASFIVCAIIAVALYLLFINYPRGFAFRYGFVALSVFIYWVSYTALTRPSIFSVVRGYAMESSPIAVPLPKLVIHRPAKKYSNSGLNENDITFLAATVEKIMAEKKPFLQPELSINDLAVLTKCNRHHLSQVLNETLRRSFYDYINHYRIEEAKQLLLDPGREDHKIASIAYDAGFNSLSTFNDVFKKMTGRTPSQYRKQRSEESTQQRV